MSGNYFLFSLLCFFFFLEGFPIVLVLRLGMVPTECLFWPMMAVNEKLQSLNLYKPELFTCLVLFIS